MNRSSNINIKINVRDRKTGRLGNPWLARFPGYGFLYWYMELLDSDFIVVYLEATDKEHHNEF